ncbi:phosphodiesterase YaeI [Desulfobacterales bacterium HSG2]|nr:phosphodiesterase YaeI [Desulfobacterales bacterium HSG2]
MKITRRKFIASIERLSVLAGAGSAYMRCLESDWFEVTEKSVRINRFSNPLRILHLSDFHASECVSLKTIEKAIDLSLEQQPDVACVTGDFITGWLQDIQDVPQYRRILRKLASAIPTFACIGNHDGERPAFSRGYKDFSKVGELLRSGGIHFLSNEKTRVEINHRVFAVAGLDDYRCGDMKPELVLKEKREEDIPIFVMSHNPMSRSELMPYDWDVLLCGHTHGGQLVVPIIGYRPFLPAGHRSFPEGLLSWGNRHIHITRGIGNLHGLRFNCRPEISMLNVA